MSKMIEVPDELYADLAEAAKKDGTTPVGWIAARLRLLRRHGNAAPNGQTLAERAAALGLLGVVNSRRAERNDEPSSARPETKPGKTMADRFAGRLGLIDSGGDGLLSQNTGESFTDYLEAKRRAGRL